MKTELVYQISCSTSRNDGGETAYLGAHTSPLPLFVVCSGPLGKVCGLPPWV